MKGAPHVKPITHALGRAAPDFSFEDSAPCIIARKQLGERQMVREANWLLSRRWRY